MPYSSTENDGTDNSTECFAQAPPPPARNSNSCPTASSGPKACCAESDGVRGDKGACNDDEGKYWYCDSDCEDCEDATTPCRSSLVRTIGEKRACAGQCDCNSCATADELDDLDAAIPCTVLHQNSPSMISDGTLKAVEMPSDITDGNGSKEADGEDPRTPLNRTPVPGQQSNCKFGVNTGDISSTSPSWTKGKDCVVTKFGKPSIEASDSPKAKCNNKQSAKEDDDDPSEHVYGEICENGTSGSGGEERLYFTIDNNAKNCTDDCGRTDPCVTSCCAKAKSHKELCVNRTNKHLVDSRVKSNCCSSCKCSSKMSSPQSKTSTTSTSNSNSNHPAVVGTKVNILTPKIASLKCLKPKGSFSAVTSSSCSWLPSRKLVRKKNNSKDKKNSNATLNSSSTQSLESAYPTFHSSCIDFGEKLQQGRYPSTKTVSDNFDTDSDYVQLPPLAASQQKNQSLWKFVKSGKKTSSQCTKHCKQCAAQSTSSLNISNGLNSLPRRHKFDSSLSISKNDPPKLSYMRVTSKSTMALNTIANEQRKPEPPPKPPKRNSTNSNVAENDKGRAVDARFIATTPQILVQTAYATAAPVAIPSKAEILCRRSKVASSGLQSNFNARSILKRPPAASNLFHSHSVDNIYDAVASDEVPEPRPLTPSPPPCRHSEYMKSSMVVKPNNYIDVHASAHQNRKSCPNANDKLIYAAPSEGSVSLNGKNSIFNRCGSVPNNLNNFFIGLQNLKPLSRSPIVHPGTTSAMSGSNNNNSNNANNNGTNHIFPGERNDAVHARLRSVHGLGQNQCREPPRSEEDNVHARCATIYTSQLTQSQIQQFKAELYSDTDYVIFPPKDPRLSQQEYYESKSLSYSTLPGATSAVPYGISGIPPPYLPPPPPYAATTGIARRPPAAEPPQLPARPNLIPGGGKSSLTNGSCSANSLSSCHKSYGSIYKPGSTTSQCSSQYTRGCYGPMGSLHLNEENIQRFLSTQSLTSSNISSAPPVYYPCSTQSAPPLPPYNRTHGNNPEYSIIIENEMRKAVQNHLMNHPGSGSKLSSLKEEKIRLKLCRSEESIYVQSPKTVEEQLLAMHNLPPPPPYSRPKVSTSE